MARKKSPTTQPTAEPRAWDINEMKRAIKSGTARSQTATLKRIGLIDAKGQLTNRYKAWGKPSRTETPHGDGSPT